MRFNMKELAALSRGPPENFDKEGSLRVHRMFPGVPQKPPDSKERWCRLRGNLLFLMKSPTQQSDPEEVIVLERCHVVESCDNHSAFHIKFESGEADLCLEAGDTSALLSWTLALREGNSEGLRNRILHLRRLLMATTAGTHTDGPGAGTAGAGVILVPKLPLVEFSLECRELTAPARERNLSSVVQVSVVDACEQILSTHSCTEIVEFARRRARSRLSSQDCTSDAVAKLCLSANKVQTPLQGTRDPLFLTGVTFPPDYRLGEETRFKLTVYNVKDRSQEARSFLGYTTFAVGDLLKSKEQQLTLSLRKRLATAAKFGGPAATREAEKKEENFGTGSWKHS